MYHFSDELKPDYIKHIADTLHLTNHVYIEKYIMDFEIYYYLSAQLASILRGGMCMPFHTGLDVQRLSIDIDLFTKLPPFEIDEIMQSLNGAITNVSITKHHPIHPLPIPNLQTYNVEYDSSFSNRNMIKIDFMCDVNLNLPTKHITDEYRILDFKIDYPLYILARGALISDKITSLGLKTIGMRPKTRILPAELPKQVYDISTLLKISTRQDIADSFGVFQNLTQFKASIFENGKYGVLDVIDDVESSLCSLFIFEYQVAISNEYASRLASFINSYLQSNKYWKSKHIPDLLLVWLYVKFLKKSLNNPNLSETLIDKINSIFVSYREILNSTVDEKNILKKQMLDTMPDLNFSPRILRSSTCEIVYLIREINLI